MNLYQCEKKAQEIGFDNAKFVALFPCGPTQCQWIDAYMGMFRADVDGLRDGFLTTGQIDSEYPDLFCSEPFAVEDGPNKNELTGAPLLARPVE